MSRVNLPTENMDIQDILAQAEIDRQNSLSRIAEIETAIQEQQEQQAKLNKLSKIKMTLKQLLQFSEELW